MLDIKINCFSVFCMTEFIRIRWCNENPTTCKVTAFVNVNGQEPVLNPGLLSRRSDKSSTTPRSDTNGQNFMSKIQKKDTNI